MAKLIPKYGRSEVRRGLRSKGVESVKLETMEVARTAICKGPVRGVFEIPGCSIRCRHAERVFFIKRNCGR